MLRVPELNAVLHVGSHESRVEGENYLPGPAGPSACDPAQGVVGVRGCQHCQLMLSLAALRGETSGRFSL